MTIPLLFAESVGNPEVPELDVLIVDVVGSVVLDAMLLDEDKVRLKDVPPVLSGIVMLDDPPVPIGPAVETLVPIGAVPDAGGVVLLDAGI